MPFLQALQSIQTWAGGWSIGRIVVPTLSPGYDLPFTLRPSAIRRTSLVGRGTFAEHLRQAALVKTGEWRNIGPVVTYVITEPTMSMVKTLKQIGNSYGVIIDKPILEILHITPETPLEITTDGRSLQIRPVRQRKRPTLGESLDAVNRRHASTLKKLAK